MFEKWLKELCFRTPTEQARCLAMLAWNEQQAKIDSLMLEYCPDEMTSEQYERYEESQIEEFPDGIS